MFVNRPVRIRGLRRGLGAVATPVAGSMILSSNPISQRIAVLPTFRRPVMWPRPVGPSTPYPWSAGNSPYGSTPQNPTGSQLATAQALLQTNPSLLNPTQWAMLQQAGLVANTVPYSSASQVTTGSGAIDPNTGQPYASELAAAQAGAIDPSTGVPYSQEASGSSVGSSLSTVYGGLPLYAWLGLGVGAYLLLGSKGRR